MLAHIRTGRRSLWLILAVALLVRGIYVLEIDQSPLFEYPAVDSKTYTNQALNLAAGNWLRVRKSTLASSSGSASTVERVSTKRSR